MKAVLRPILALIGLVFTMASLADEPTATVRFGRALFQGYAPWSKAEMATVNGLPTEFSACARCHGPTGAGRTEAGVAAPSLRWQDLLKIDGDAPAYKGRAAVLNAIEHGVGRGERQLAAAMPRFNLSDREKQALLDYLQIVGSNEDQPRGVTNHEIRIGALLPLQNPSAAIGLAVQQGLRQAIDRVNQSGGIYGRRLELIVYPVAPDAETIMTGLEYLLVKERIYTLVASFTDIDEEPARQLLEQRLSIARVSDIAALSQPLHRLGSNQNWRAPLLPAIDEQVEKLRRGLRQACPDSSGDWVLSEPNIVLPMVGERLFSDLGLLISNLQNDSSDLSRPRTIISTVAGSGTRELADRLKQWRAQFGTDKAQPKACIGYLPFKAGVLSDWPTDWTEALVSPLPRAAVLEAREQHTDVWAVMGRWSGQVLIEALSQAGPHLYERALLDALPALNGRELRAGVTLAYRRGYFHGWEPTVTVIKPAAKSPGSEPTDWFDPVVLNSAY